MPSVSASIEGAPPARRRGSVTNNDQFFQTKQAAAVLKHGILSRYPTVFATMTGAGSADGRVVYLDGYAGPGRYEPENGGAHGEPGSPLLAIQTAATVRAWRRNLHCIFVERKRAYADNLRAVLGQEASDDLCYEVLDGDVQDHIDYAFAVAGSSPLFVFLDPFGTALPYVDLRDKLLKRDARLKTEVLLNFNVNAVSRIGGYLTGELKDDETTSTGRSATLERMDKFLGGQWWRDTFSEARRLDADGSAAKAALHVVEQFRLKIQADTGFESFAVPIRRRPEHHPLFVMLLFYRYEGAPYQFNESASKANEDWRRYLSDIAREDRLASIDDGELHLFDVELANYTSDYLAEQAREAEHKLDQHWISLITNNIRDLVARGPIPVSSRIGAILGTTLGLAREKHLTRAWDTLAGDKVVEPRDKQVKPRKQTIQPTGQ